MLRKSTALTAGFTALVSLLNLDTSKPITLGLNKEETSTDTFIVYGTLDSGATDGTNAQQLYVGLSGTTPAEVLEAVAQQAALWPYSFLGRSGGATAGTYYVTGDQTDAATVATTAAPAAGAYSTVIDLTAYGAQGVRIGGDRQMLVGDKFEVYVTQDSTVSTSTGCKLAGTITGGGGVNQISKIVAGWPYAIIKGITRSTAGGNILAAGVKAPAAGAIGYWQNGGNAFGAPGVLGTTDAQTMTLIAGNAAFLTDAGTAGGATTYGRATTTSTTNVQSGTGGTNLGTNATDHPTVIGSITGASPLTAQCGTGPALLAANGTDHQTTIGSNIGASPGAFRAGTGGLGIAVTSGPLSLSTATAGSVSISSALDVTVLAALAGVVSLQPGATGNVRLPPRAAGAGNTTPLHFLELVASGNNFVGLRGPDTLAGDTVYVLPVAFPTITGQELTSDTSGNLAWSNAINVRARSTSTQAVTDGNPASIVTGWAETTDSGGAFNPGTGVFTAPQDGFVQVSAQIEYGAVAANLNAEFSVSIFLAGVELATSTTKNQVAALNTTRQVPPVTLGFAVTAGQAVDIRTAISGVGTNGALSGTVARQTLSLTYTSR